MTLAPSSRPDGRWTVLDLTGKSVSQETFESRADAIAWITDNGHEAYNSDGGHTDER